VLYHAVVLCGWVFARAFFIEKRHGSFWINDDAIYRLACPKFTDKLLLLCFQGVFMGYYRGQTVLGKSQDNRAMLANVNAYNQAIEKALGEKE
jgi:hypothetical protein